MPKFKRPSRRRLKKWRARVERFAHRGTIRGPHYFFGELFRQQPLIEAARAVGVDLLDRLPRSTEIDPETMQRALYRFILRREPDPWPSRENLEI